MAWDGRAAIAAGFLWLRQHLREGVAWFLGTQMLMTWGCCSHQGTGPYDSQRDATEHFFLHVTRRAFFEDLWWVFLPGHCAAHPGLVGLRNVMLIKTDHVYCFSLAAWKLREASLRLS